MPTPRCVIVGGGITGLAAALRLREHAKREQTDVDITVLEASAHPGGKLYTERVGDCIIDAGPDIMLASKPQGVAFCESLGIADRLQPTNPATRTTYIRRGDTLIPEMLYADLPLVTPRGGMQEMTDAAAKALPAGTIVTNAEAVSISQANDAYRVTTADGRTFIADTIIIAIPAPPAAQLLATIHPEAGALVAQVPYIAMTTVSAAFRTVDVPHALDGYGYIIPDAAPGTPTACTWTSVKIEGRAPRDIVLLRGYVRGQDDDAETLIIQEMRTTLGITVEPLFTRAYRWTYGIPVYDTEHVARTVALCELLKQTPELTIAGGALDGAGISDSIMSAHAEADAMWPHIRRLQGVSF